MKYYELRNGKIVSESAMTKVRMHTADLYDGKVESPLPININHKLAIRIRNMTNAEFVRTWGLASRSYYK